MELLLFLVIGIVWTVAQALMKSKQPQPADPRSDPRLRGPAPQQPRPAVPVRQPVFKAAPEADTVYTGTTIIAPPLEDVFEVSSEDAPVFSDVELVRGIVMAEVLGSPRSRKPHTYRSLKNRRH